MTPTTWKLMPLILMSAPTGSSPSANSWSRTRWPITATLRRSLLVELVDRAPVDDLERDDILDAVEAALHAERAVLRLVHRVRRTCRPRCRPSSGRWIDADAADVLRDGFDVLGLEARCARPIGMPSYGICVVPCDHRYTVFVMRGKPLSTPFARPLPAPNNTVSMKMPQNTPNAVSAVRSLCRRSVLKISRHFSRSIIRHRHRFGGSDLRGVQRRHEAREHAHGDEQHQRRDRGAEIERRIHEVRHLRAGAAQREGHELEQADADRRARVARDAGHERRLEQQRAHDAERRRAERLADADLLRALLDRDDHDVADADDAGGQRAEADEPDEHVDADEQAGHALHGLGHVEGVHAAVVVRRDLVPALERAR